MGDNHKFSLSWLYNKLRNPKTCTTITTTSKSISKSASPQIKARPDMIPPAPAPDGDTRNSNPRKSYYFTRELTRETLAKHFLDGSLRQKSTRKTIGFKEPVEEKSGTRVSSCSLSPSASTSNAISCSSPPRHRPRRPSLEFRLDRVPTPGPVDKMTSSSSSCTVQSLSNPDTVAGDVMVGVANPLGLFPMFTYKKKEVVKDTVAEQRHGSSKGFHLSTSAKSPGMSIKAHSPRLLASARGMQDRKGAVMQRRNGETNGKYGGDVVVKSTFDPWRDFRDSMVEMIIENRIKESKDLEDLLMHYLSLNSVEYHDVIIAVFKQVWCNVTDIRLNETSF